MSKRWQTSHKTGPRSVFTTNVVTHYCGPVLNPLAPLVASAQHMHCQGALQLGCPSSLEMHNVCRKLSVTCSYQHSHIHAPHIMTFVHAPRRGRGHDSGRVSAGIFGSLSVFQDTITALLQMARTEKAGGSHLYADRISYHPPGAPQPLLQEASLHLAANELGLVYGASGSRKTTLLQVLSGFCEATSESVWILGDRIKQADATVGKAQLSCF